MQTLSLTLARNAADVLERFVRHHADLTDLMVLLDLGSSDGTREVALALRQEGLPLLLLDAPDPALSPEAALARAWDLVTPVFEPELVYLLAAHQFIRTPGRAQLEADLAGLAPGEAAWVARAAYAARPGQGVAGDADGAFTWRFNQPAADEHLLALRRQPGQADALHQPVWGRQVLDAAGQPRPTHALQATLLADVPVRSLAQLRAQVVLDWPRHKLAHGARTGARETYGAHPLLDQLLAGRGLQDSDLLREAMRLSGQTADEQLQLVHDPIWPQPLLLHHTPANDPQAAAVTRVLTGLDGWHAEPAPVPRPTPTPTDLAPLLALCRERGVKTALLLANEDWTAAFAAALPQVQRVVPRDGEDTPAVDLLFVPEPPQGLEADLLQACDPARIGCVAWGRPATWPMADNLAHWARQGWTPDLLNTLAWRARASYASGRQDLLVLQAAAAEPAPRREAVAQALAAMAQAPIAWTDPAPACLLSPFDACDLGAAPVPTQVPTQVPAKVQATLQTPTPAAVSVSPIAAAPAKGPRSVLIAGAGRSGTSCLAGLFDPAIHHHARDLYAPQLSNPKGFFEAAHINDLNESMQIASALAAYGEARTRELLAGHEPHQLWLARFPDAMPAFWTDEHRRQIAAALPASPFCLKDPRMALTLPAWLAQAPDALVLSIHRPPAVTAASILRECSIATYLLDYRISARDAFRIWHLSYRRLVKAYRAGADVCFLRYEDLFDPQRLALLEAEVGAPLRRDFAEKSLRRTESDLVVAPEHQALFELLEALSQRCFLHDRAGDARLIDTFLQAWPIDDEGRVLARRPSAAVPA